VSVRISVIDQPFGGSWLGDLVRGELASNDWSSFDVAVAWARLSGVRKIQGSLRAFAQRPGTTVRMIVGIDQGGTSIEAMQLLWRLLQPRGRLYIYQDPIGNDVPTFHPKLFLFGGQHVVRAFLGSSNLTRGGLYANQELDVQIDVQSADAESAAVETSLRQAIANRLPPAPSSRLVDPPLMDALHRAGDLPSEVTLRRERRVSSTARGLARRGRGSLFGAGPRVRVPPDEDEPMGLPPAPVIVTVPPRLVPVPVVTAPAPTPGTVFIPARLLIEVIPHHNGEVFLSYRAVREHPSFFGWPFAGLTVPRNPANAPYPMAAPDPLVNINVHNGTGAVVRSIVGHSLNVVDYESKSEIRVTVPDGIQRLIPAMSVLEMRRDPQPNVDYELNFFPPGSPQAAASAVRLTERLSTGGRPGPGRRYGWS
jgi:HKD family nuclease